MVEGARKSPVGFLFGSRIEINRQCSWTFSNRSSRLLSVGCFQITTKYLNALEYLTAGFWVHSLPSAVGRSRNVWRAMASVERSLFSLRVNFTCCRGKTPCGVAGCLSPKEKTGPEQQCSSGVPHGYPRRAILTAEPGHDLSPQIVKRTHDSSQHSRSRPV